MPRPQGSWLFRALAVTLAIFACSALPAGGAEPKPAKQPKQPKPVKPAPEQFGENLCPEAISVEQRVAAVPDGWAAVSSDAKSSLSMVTFFDGPPAEHASLKYDSEVKERGNWVATWTLAPGTRGYWVQCSYDNTVMVLSRRLPDSVTTCKVTYERKTRTPGGLPTVAHVGCR